MTIIATTRVLLHELTTPLTVLISACDLLYPRVPKGLQPSLAELRDLGHRLGQDVAELRAQLHERIDAQYPVQAAAQIRQWAIEHGAPPHRLAALLETIQAAAVQLPDPLLNHLLNQSLVSGVRELIRIQTRLTALQPEELELHETLPLE